MQKSTTLLITLLCVCLIGMAGSAGAAFTEPSMVDYTAVPVFANQATTPNILIILDNSLSMNYNAYGTPISNGNNVPEPFTGEPYSTDRTFQITSGQDDAEERTSVGNITHYDSADLDIGSFDVGANNAILGLRFQNVAIPQGATIQSAYIEFTADKYNNETTNILIEGEASDDATPFDTVADNIKSRTPTTATAAWEGLTEWSPGVNYGSADITEIVQEIVSRPGWVSDNAMVFRFTSNSTDDNKRDAKSYDADPSAAPRLHVVFDEQPSITRYYGYFNPDFFYTYDGNKFVLKYKKIGYDFGGNVWKVENLGGSAATLSNSDIVNQKLWDGNWLNWCCMRRVDVLRKVLMGGKATSRTGGGNTNLVGEDPNANWLFSRKWDSSSLSAVSPYHGNFRYRVEDNYLKVDTNNDNRFTYGDAKYTIKVDKEEQYEPEEFVDGNLGGLLQKIGQKANWANMWYNYGFGNGESGGRIASFMGTNLTSLITDLENTGMTTYTPLAETFYVAMQYFKQEACASGMDYPNSNYYLGKDPYDNGTELVPCAKSFVILLTDGASTKDSQIPDEYKDYDGDNKEVASCTESSCQYPMGGSDYLDDLALYAHTVDLRTDEGMDDDQTLTLYAIHAFDKDENATQLLTDAARNGGFIDRNGNNRPDLVEEYDKDGDGLPDTFFEADDGYQIEAKLLTAIEDILDRASSGTSASVLATNSEGEGNMLQAYFQPIVQENLQETNWLGYMHSLWVDSYGNLYEDNSNSDSDSRTFDSGDNQITFDTNGSGDVCFHRNGDTTSCIPLKDGDLKPLFEVGALLAARNPNSRKIFTYIDQDQDGAVDETSYNPYDAGGELVAFDATALNLIQPFLGVRDDAKWGDSGAKLGSTQSNRVRNIITWVRGTDVAGLRNRTINGVTWPLGDIINSTPVSVSRPTERFNLWYSDTSYQAYWDAFKNRENFIYVGSNDGMLHAFTSWHYNVTAKAYEKNGVTEELGDEIWAFIPQSVLPHLKWTAHTGYTHTYLADGKPRIFDAKIIENDLHYNDGEGGDDWGTILVMGLNMGAKQISVNEDFDGSGVVERTFNPSYICMDITEPRNPRLLWERSYPDQAMSRATPIPVKVDDQWFLVFGSGPTDYDGFSSQEGYIFVVDMKSGDLLQRFGPYDSDAFFATGAAFDKNLNYNVDAIYLGDTYWASNKWQGGLYKVAVPCTNCEWDPDYDPGQPTEYDTNPANWIAHKFFDSDQPITAAPSISVEYYPDFQVDNVWIYFGTGRYISEDDKASTDPQYLYGIKDPYFNKKKYEGSLFNDYSAAAAETLERSDLFDSDEITVTTAGDVLENGSLYEDGQFTTLVDEIREDWDGWYYALDTSASSSERMISKPAVFGGIAFYPTFTPNTEICKGEGTTNFYALYFLTGTGFTKQILTIDNPTSITYNNNGQTVTADIVAVKLPTSMQGAPPPSVGLHTGKEDGAKAFIQLSTGVVELLDVSSAIYSLSTITDWWDRTDKAD
jgi:type IV pilus assembly protein PilY1